MRVPQDLSLLSFDDTDWAAFTDPALTVVTQPAYELGRTAAKLIFDDWKKFDVPLEVIRNDFSYKIFPDDIPQKWRQVMVDSADFLLAHKFIDKAPDWATFFNDAPIKKAASITSQMK